MLLDPFVSCDSDLRLISANEPATLLAGLQEELRIGHPVYFVLPWLNAIRADLESIADHPGDTSRILTTDAFQHRVRKSGNLIGILSVPQSLPPDGAAEQTRRDMQERLELAQQVAGLAVWDRDLSHDRISWSPEMYRMLGLEPGEINPTVAFWRAHIHHADIVRVVSEAEETIRQCGSRETEFRIVTADGSVRNILSRWKVFCDAENSPVRMVGVNLDVTRHREVDSRLLEINAQLAAIIQASPAPIVALTPDGLVTLWNPAAERLFGWTADEVLGRSLPFIPEERREEHASLRRRDLQGDSLRSLHLRRVRKDGSPVDISVSTATMRDAGGQVTGIMSLYEDITERLRSERDLRESQERFRTLVEATPQLVWSTAADGLVDYLSRQWVEYTGVPEEQHHGPRWILALHPDDRARAARSFGDAVAGRARYDVEYRIRRHDGQYRWFKARGLPFVDFDGRTIKWLGTCTDIEDQRSIVDALLRANADLQQFAYAAAHDLQEPLRNIALYSQLMERRYSEGLSPEARCCLQHAFDGARRMQTLIEDLLAYTQAATIGDQPTAAVDCNAVLAEVLGILANSLKERDAQVESTNLPVVHAHRTRLVQLFQNLISNAIKYGGPRPPAIRVSASRAEDQWLFHVEDRGEGIAAEYQERIFGVFRRLHGRDVPGTGIGLAICKRIVEHYGGRIGVLSDGPGQGSTFWFTLPAD
ncbi:MAG: PAS domain-containing protein [Bryobacteraceae bacterium]|nr:PAS domain-containing protein [Bryobacteraceae bacterium]